MHHCYIVEDLAEQAQVFTRFNAEAPEFGGGPIELKVAPDSFALTGFESYGEKRPTHAC